MMAALAATNLCLLGLMQLCADRFYRDQTSVQWLR
jgi:hypothetical protein